MNGATAHPSRPSSCSAERAQPFRSLRRDAFQGAVHEQPCVPAPASSSAILRAAPRRRMTFRHPPARGSPCDSAQAGIALAPLRRVRERRRRRSWRRRRSIAMPVLPDAKCRIPTRIPTRIAINGRPSRFGFACQPIPRCRNPAGGAGFPCDGRKGRSFEQSRFSGFTDAIDDANIVQHPLACAVHPDPAALAAASDGFADHAAASLSTRRSVGRAGWMRRGRRKSCRTWPAAPPCRNRPCWSCCGRGASATRRTMPTPLVWPDPRAMIVATILISGPGGLLGRPGDGVF